MKGLNEANQRPARNQRIRYLLFNQPELSRCPPLAIFILGFFALSVGTAASYKALGKPRHLSNIFDQSVVSTTGLFASRTGFLNHDINADPNNQFWLEVRQENGGGTTAIANDMENVNAMEASGTEVDDESEEATDVDIIGDLMALEGNQTSDNGLDGMHTELVSTGPSGANTIPPDEDIIGEDDDLIAATFSPYEEGQDYGATSAPMDGILTNDPNITETAVPTQPQTTTQPTTSPAPTVAPQPTISPAPTSVLQPTTAPRPSQDETSATTTPTIPIIVNSSFVVSIPSDQEWVTASDPLVSAPKEEIEGLTRAVAELAFSVVSDANLKTAKKKEAAATSEQRYLRGNTASLGRVYVKQRFLQDKGVSDWPLNEPVDYDRSSATIIEIRPRVDCPESNAISIDVVGTNREDNNPDDVVCVTVFSQYEVVAAESEDAAIVYTTFVADTQHAIDDGELQEKLLLVDADSKFIILEPSEPVSVDDAPESTIADSSKPDDEDVTDRSDSSGIDPLLLGLIVVGCVIGCIVCIFLGVYSYLHRSKNQNDEEDTPWAKDTSDDYYGKDVENPDEDAALSPQEMHPDGDIDEDEDGNWPTSGQRGVSDNLASNSLSEEEQREEYRQRIGELIADKCPEEEDNLEELLDQFRGREAALLATLENMEEVERELEKNEATTVEDVFDDEDLSVHDFKLEQRSAPLPPLDPGEEETKHEGIKESHLQNYGIAGEASESNPSEVKKEADESNYDQGNEADGGSIESQDDDGSMIKLSAAIESIGLGDENQIVSEDEAKEEQQVQGNQLDEGENNEDILSAFLCQPFAKDEMTDASKEDASTMSLDQDKDLERELSETMDAAAGEDEDKTATKEESASICVEPTESEVTPTKVDQNMEEDREDIVLQSEKDALLEGESSFPEEKEKAEEVPSEMQNSRSSDCTDDTDSVHQQSLVTPTPALGQEEVEEKAMSEDGIKSQEKDVAASSQAFDEVVETDAFELKSLIEKAGENIYEDQKEDVMDGTLKDKNVPIDSPSSQNHDSDDEQSGIHESDKISEAETDSSREEMVVVPTKEKQVEDAVMTSKSPSDETSGLALDDGEWGTFDDNMGIASSVGVSEKKKADDAEDDDNDLATDAHPRGFEEVDNTTKEATELHDVDNDKDVSIPGDSNEETKLEDDEPANEKAAAPIKTPSEHQPESFNGSDGLDREDSSDKKMADSWNEYDIGSDEKMEDDEFSQDKKSAAVGDTVNNNSATENTKTEQNSPEDASNEWKDSTEDIDVIENAMQEPEDGWEVEETSDNAGSIDSHNDGWDSSENAEGNEETWDDDTDQEEWDEDEEEDWEEGDTGDSFEESWGGGEAT